MNSTQYTISEPRRNNNNSNSKGKSLFYGLHVPFFLFKHITHEPELIYCIFFFITNKTKTERQSEKIRNRTRKQYPNAL